jgi:nucleoside-diphosphate-sugar epimerase
MARIRHGRRRVINHPASASRGIIALTGATGFIGRRLVVALSDAGWKVRLLLRRDPVVPEWQGIDPQIVAGDLGDPRALDLLVEGATQVVHVAGLIKAARRSDFYAVNAGGSVAVAEAMTRHAPEARLLHVSTIAAREPGLSDYAGSKRAGEDAVRRQLGSRVTVIRPPVVYGPGDRETLVFFQMARGRFVPLAGLPAARAAVIHVDDLISLMVAMLRAPDGGVWSAADARPQGYSWAEVFGAAAHAVGNPRARLFHAPAAMLKTAALVGDVGSLFGAVNMLTSKKLRELRHVDWAVPEAEHARPPGWTPRHNLQEGFDAAAAWYRAAGWLPRD